MEETFSFSSEDLNIEEFLDEVDGEMLIEIYLLDPFFLHKICSLYTLNLQINKETFLN